MLPLLTAGQGYIYIFMSSFKFVTSCLFLVSVKKRIKVFIYLLSSTWMGDCGASYYSLQRTKRYRLTAGVRDSDKLTYLFIQATMIRKPKNGKV